MEKYKDYVVIQDLFGGSARVRFFDTCTAASKEKQSVARKEIGKIQRSKTQQKIYDAIEELQGGEKITAKSVSQKVGISLVTVKRYWPEFKEYVNELNDKIKK